VLAELDPIPRTPAAPQSKDPRVAATLDFAVQLKLIEGRIQICAVGHGEYINEAAAKRPPSALY
jgi:hypothetical protein